MAEKLNILFDFDLVFKSSYDNSYRTGLFNVEYNILLEMLKNYSDKFNFFATCKCNEKIYNDLVLKAFPEFKEIKFLNIYSKRNEFKKVVNFYIINLKKNKTFFSKIKIIFLKIYKIAFSLFKNKKEPNIDFINIYQSFFYKIPDIILENNKIKKFTILHDILPYTNPEYFEEDSKNYEKCRQNFKDKYLYFKDKDINVFVISQYTLNEVNKNLPELKNTNYIVNLISYNKNQYFVIDKNKIDKNILSKYNIPQNTSYILSLSSLNKRKNLPFLIDTFIQFLEKNKNIKDLNLVLAGPKGWMFDDIFNSINNAEKYKDRIILTGFVDEKDINIIYNLAYAFVFPSLAEGFGIPVLEAMACGIPVLSSNLTSLPEVYGDAALSFNPTKKEELVECLEKIYNDKDFRENLIQKGLNRVKKFSWEKTTKNMINEYLK